MLKYNLNIQGNKKCKGNQNIIRKNIRHMDIEEINFIKNLLNHIKELNITKHAIEKNLINKYEIQNIIRNKQYKIIDYDYDLKSKEERILIRTKKEYLIENNSNNDILNCYIKVVISITNNTIITTWANAVDKEESKNNNIKTNYINNFDIINKKIKIC